MAPTQPGNTIRTELDQEQVDSYRRQGFLKVENFLGTDELVRMREAVAEHVEQLGKKVISTRQRKGPKSRRGPPEGRPLGKPISYLRELYGTPLRMA